MLKCRLNPIDRKSVASILTSGVIDIFDIEGNGSKLGKLAGLTDESFCLDWNKKRDGLLVSAAQGTFCVWDV